MAPSFLLLLSGTLLGALATASATPNKLDDLDLLKSDRTAVVGDSDWEAGRGFDDSDKQDPKGRDAHSRGHDFAFDHVRRHSNGAGKPKAFPPFDLPPAGFGAFDSDVSPVKLGSPGLANAVAAVPDLADTGVLLLLSAAGLFSASRAKMFRRA